MVVNLACSFIFLQKILQRVNASPEAYRKHQKGAKRAKFVMITGVTFAHAQKMPLCSSAVTLSQSPICGEEIAVCSHLYIYYSFTYSISYH